MPDLIERQSLVIERDDLRSLRTTVMVKDSISKTEKWLRAQIHERIAAIESFKGQIHNLNGMIEVKSEELEELNRRLAALSQITE